MDQSIEHSEQAQKSIGLIKILHYKCGGLPPVLAFQLLDKMVVPIDNYAAEIWGFK